MSPGLRSPEISSPNEPRASRPWLQAARQMRHLANNGENARRDVLFQPRPPVVIAGNHAVDLISISHELGEGQRFFRFVDLPFHLCQCSSCPSTPGGHLCHQRDSHRCLRERGKSPLSLPSMREYCATESASSYWDLAFAPVWRLSLFQDAFQWIHDARHGPCGLRPSSLPTALHTQGCHGHATFASSQYS
jgi:hypothetical protein